MENLEISVATLEDYTDVAGVLLSLDTEERRGRFFAVTGDAVIRAHARLAVQQQAAIIARVDDLAVGVAEIIRVDDKRVELAFATRHGYGRHGFASALVNFAIQIAIQRGFKRIIGECLLNNRASVGVFHKCGFIHTPNYPEGLIACSLSIA